MSYITRHYLKAVAFLKIAWFLPLVVALGIYSITRLLVEDSIFDPVRNWVFDRFPHQGYTTEKKPKRGVYQIISQGKFFVTEGTKIGKLFECPWCMGFWVAALVCLGLLFSPIWTAIVLTPFALRVLPGLFMSKEG